MNVETARRRLALAGIACSLLISGFDIHRWRVDPWRDFEARFAAAKAELFGIPVQPDWLYAVGLPAFAVNFWCLVQIARGKREGLLPPFVLSAAAIALMPLFGGQGVIYRMIWPDVLTLAGFAIGGAIAVLLAVDDRLETPIRTVKRRTEPMPLHFELVTPERQVRSEEVHMVVVPGTDGAFGVLEGHAPFMSTIADGTLEVYRTAGGAPETIPVRGGFAEVGEKGLTVLAEKVETEPAVEAP